MPKLFDLLSERTDKDALMQLQKNVSSKRRPKKTRKRKPDSSPIKRTAHRNRSLYVPDFIAIDVETTGLDAKNDRIIEIGAVKFVRGKPCEEFLSFIDPCQPIPPKISELTRITDESVADAPLFKDIIDDLIAFIGHLSLCGHQVIFDYNFLNTELKRAGREPLRNRLLDTAILSRLLLFGLPGYSLGHVCKHLGIVQKNAHRALDDAQVSGKIASLLIPQLNDIPLHIRMIMGRFAPPSLLKTILVKSVDNRKDIPVLEPERTFFKPHPRLPMPESLEPVEKDLIDHCFEDAGALSQLMEGYCTRPSQIQMALSVTDALNQQSCFVAEADTGTGKSMAYLIPAAHWAVTNNCRVLVSTHTKNLQDQLVSKDLPIIDQVVGKGFRYSILKGRSNYLCRNRWNRFLSGELGNLSPRERQGILPLIRWAEETDVGDIEGQNQFNRRWFAKVWSLISAESHGCLGRRCPLFNSCFLQHARQKALGSHIVVINHALFFSEVCAESSFLGKTGTIIFDEAHHLESCGHKYLRVELDTNRVNRYLEFMNNLVKVLEKSIAHEDIEIFKKYKSILKRLRKNGNQFLSDSAEWAMRESVESEQGGNTTNYLFAYRDNPFSGFSGLAGFQLVLKDMQDILFSLQDMSSEQGDGSATLRSDISACIDKTSQLKADLIYLTNAGTDDHVFWVEGDRKKGWVKLCGVPLDVGGLLYTLWKSNSSAIIFTSATMTVSGSIDYFKYKVGLIKDLEERTFFKVFRSPFTSEQMFRCAVDSELTPDSDGYNDYIAGVVIRLLNTFDKNILMLFTANAMLYSVYDILRNCPHFPADGLFLAQGLSGTRATLLEKFKESKKSVLLGTSSFWEGIDVPGKACELVVIPRLPFPVPTHPLTQALAARIKEQHGDSFYNFSVPEAVIKFRQGAGRLIRSGKDRGAFIVLDGRIINKAYGKVFIGSLEGTFEKSADVDEMIEKVAAFFKTT